MANNPILANEISFYLRFNSLGNPNFYRISEPIGFDNAKFVLEQESKRFARSVKYGAIDKLRFPNKKAEKNSIRQVINPQGNTSIFLDYGFQWLIYIYSEYGFEMDVDFLIKVNGVDFKIYGLNVADKDVTDGYTYFQCSLIDNSKVMDYKRRMDDKLNAFGTKGIFEQVVTPIPTFNYLKRATPENQRSKFRSNNQVTSAFSSISNFGGTLSYTNWGGNNCNITDEHGIDNTLSFISNNYATSLVSGFMTPNDTNFTYIEAKQDLTNVTINITNIVASAQAFFSTNSYVGASSSGIVKLMVMVSDQELDLGGFTPYTLWSKSFTKSNPSGNLPSAVPSQFTLNLPSVQRGFRIYIYFTAQTTLVPVGGLPSIIGLLSSTVNITSLDIEINAISTALDNVVTAVRYVDLIKQGNLMVHDLPFNASLFTSGGRFFDQAVFNKRMVTQRNDFLYFTLKDIFGSVEEVCADVELNENELFIGQYPDYYTNDEIGVYSVIPSETLNIDVNDRFATNKMLYNYSKFAQDRTILGSTQSVHTQSEWKIQNTKVENSKEVKNDLIRDPLMIQDIVNQEISKPTTSTDDDNNLCIEDMIALAPNSFGIINARLFIRVVNGNLEILNRTIVDSNDSVVINWITQGLSVGMTVEVLNGTNTGFYTVVSLTSTVLVLQPNTITVVLADGDWFIQIKHFYTNVQWQTRTNQGFALIDGVGSSFANLRYTIKRNLFYWYPYLATMVMYCKKDIINSFFKSNGKLKTRLTTETVDVIEDAPILYADLPQPILTGKIYNLTVVSNYQDEIDRLNLYEGIGASRLPNPKKGFCRFLDLKGNVIKGYIQKSEYLLASNQLMVTIEEKYEAQILVVNYANGVLTVNDTTYQLSGNTQWFKTENDFVRFFDAQNKPICNFYKYNFVVLNSITYTSINDLVNALNLLI
jgi:hypothetical protein